MSLDQRIARAFHEIGDTVAPPDVDVAAVRARARSRQRRTTALAVAAAAVAVVAIGASIVGGRQSAAPDPLKPSPSPTTTAWVPESITPKEVVTARRARLGSVGIAVGDPDARLSLWQSDGYLGMALTTDGFQSTTYAAVPFSGGDPGDGTIAVRVHSPRDDLFLVQTGNASAEWIVGVDGDVRRVQVVDRQVMPQDVRLWFPCESSWRYAWCALDPDTATAFRWRAWDGSAVPPGSGRIAWGANPQPRAVGSTGRLEAWWGIGGAQRVRTLATADAGDYVLGCTSGPMAFWSTRRGSGSVDLHTSRDAGASWQRASHALPGADQFWQLWCAPDGGFLAFSDKAVWRAEASGGPFRKVFGVSGGLTAVDGGTQVEIEGDVVVVTGQGVGAYSGDGGRTWQRVRTWR